MRTTILAFTIFILSTSGLAQETTTSGSWSETWESTKDFSGTLRDDFRSGAEHVIEIDKAIANVLLNMPPVKSGANALDSIVQTNLMKNTGTNEATRTALLEAKVLFLQSYQFLVDRLLDVETYMTEGEKRKLVKNLSETFISLITISGGIYAGGTAVGDAFHPHRFIKNDLQRIKDIATGKYVDGKVDPSLYTVEGPISDSDSKGDSQRSEVVNEKRKAHLEKTAGLKSWLKTSLAAVYQSAFPNSITANTALGGKVETYVGSNSFLGLLNPFSKTYKAVYDSPAPGGGVLSLGKSVVGAIGFTYIAAQGTRLTLAEAEHLNKLSQDIKTEIQRTKAEIK